MLRNYLKITWRNIGKNPFYTAINILGLSLGIGCSIVIFQFISYHIGFDTYHRYSKQLYKIVTELHLADGSIEYEQSAPVALAQAVRAEIPQVKDQAVLLQKRSFTISLPEKNKAGSKLFYENENIALADHHWFQLFDYTWQQGNPARALSEPNTAVLTHKLARKFFGNENAVGKILRLDDKHNIKVTGVLQDYPDNTDTRVDIFISLASLKNLYPDIVQPIQNDWGFINSTTSLFVLLHDDISANKVNASLSNLAKKYMGEISSMYHFKLQSLKDVHFDARYGGVISKLLLATLGLVGVLLISIACLNFINMATAHSFKRAKQVGIRKILGSTPMATFYQFITETACITFAAALCAILGVNLFLPVLNTWLHIELDFDPINNLQLLLFLISLLIFIITAAGFYPAVVLNRIKATDALKSQINQHLQSTGFTRKGLLIMQNVVAQVFIICTIVISMQVKYLKSAELGFSKSAVLMVPIPANTKSKTEYLRNELMNNSKILSVSYCYRAPLSNSEKGGTVKYNANPWEKFPVRSIIGDAYYLKTFGLQLITGRNMVESDTSSEFLVNEKFVHKLGINNYEKILGQHLVAGDFSNNAGIIVGVVKDFHAKAFYTPIEAELITTNRDWYQYAAIKLNENAPSETLNYIKKSWESAYPKNVFEYHFLDEHINNLYQKEDLLNKLIKSSALVAIIISCLGLLGIISLLTIQRTKEIGIRKVLGASVLQITAMLSMEFLKLVLLAVVIASPLALWAMNSWLNHFAYKINISWWMFALAGGLAIAIAVLTIGFQAIKAAITNPVKSLRTE